MLKPEKVLPLTSLRFFAAFSIVLSHYLQPSYLQFANNRWVQPIRVSSGTAVYFFFILSGYILSMVYLREAKSLDRRKFWVARLARVYPLYFLTILIGAISLFRSDSLTIGFRRGFVHALSVLLQNLPLLQCWIPEMTVLNFPAWSLSSEAFFYLVFPWVGLFVWRQSALRALLFFLAVYSAIQVIRLGAPGPLVAHIRPILQLHFFIAGIVLAKCVVTLPKWKVGYDWLVSHAISVLTGATVFLLLLFEFHDVLKVSIYEDIGCIFLYSLMIAAFATGNPILTKLFAPAWLVILGESSYGLYLIHVPVYAHCCLTRFDGPPSHLVFQLYVLGSIALSVLSFYFFETPARKWILRLFSTRSKEGIATASLAQ